MAIACYSPKCCCRRKVGTPRLAYPVKRGLQVRVPFVRVTRRSRRHFILLPPGAWQAFRLPLRFTLLQSEGLKVVDHEFDLLIRCGRAVCPANGWDRPSAVAVRGGR